jgi:hypothetical protein
MPPGRKMTRMPRVVRLVPFEFSRGWPPGEKQLQKDVSAARRDRQA